MLTCSHCEGQDVTAVRPGVKAAMQRTRSKGGHPASTELGLYCSSVNVLLALHAVLLVP